jgi:hypothetical protein
MRQHETTCEHCRADLPRHVGRGVYYCSEECYLAEEGLVTCPECGCHHFPEVLCCLPLGEQDDLPPVLFGLGVSLCVAAAELEAMRAHFSNPQKERLLALLGKPTE